MNQVLPQPTILSPHLAERLLHLEAEVDQPTGKVSRLATKVKEYLNKESGAAVKAGPY